MEGWGNALRTWGMAFVVGGRVFFYGDDATRQTEAQDQNRTGIPASTRQDLVPSPRASLFIALGYAAAAICCAEVRNVRESFSNNHPGPVYGKAGAIDAVGGSYWSRHLRTVEDAAGFEEVETSRPGEMWIQTVE
ncbi:hypothetical protein CSAL01_09920 [Colletotrichum salicis]|uniref:Uncharacterized protein n=1 Tax=Colletotrichum salicis TaxID=1209931 RepID=A0A135V9T7_9PEZI|nr:hypothetical protein CSAL01_09920 [Colletotrichum salicis]